MPPHDVVFARLVIQFFNERLQKFIKANSIWRDGTSRAIINKSFDVWFNEIRRSGVVQREKMKRITLFSARKLLIFIGTRQNPSKRTSSAIHHANAFFMVNDVIIHRRHCLCVCKYVGVHDIAARAAITDAWKRVEKIWKTVFLL